jgi:hypothetical protein
LRSEDVQQEEVFQDIFCCISDEVQHSPAESLPFDGGTQGENRKALFWRDYCLPQRVLKQGACIDFR